MSKRGKSIRNMFGVCMDCEAKSGEQHKSTCVVNENGFANKAAYHQLIKEGKVWGESQKLTEAAREHE